MSIDAAQANWEKLHDIIEQTFSGDRLDNLKVMYDELGERICMSPASACVYNNSCYPGGYLFHVLNVHFHARQVLSFFEKMDGDVDFNEEEMVFCALHHDLGKIGTAEVEYYIPTEESWQQKRGILYETNKHIDFMGISERSLYLLQHYGITLSEKEYLGIFLKDGLFNENNRKYFNMYDAHKTLKTNLPLIIHTADMFATRNEFDYWKKSEAGQKFLYSNEKLSVSKQELRFQSKMNKGRPKLSSSVEDTKEFQDLFGSLIDKNTKKSEEDSDT